MYAEYAHGRRSAGEFHVRSWIEGQPARPALAAECSLDFGFCVGIASAELGRHRETGRAFLGETMRLMIQASARNASQAAIALEWSITTATDSAFRGRLPAVGFGAGFLLLMPHWGVNAFKLLGNSGLWRRESNGSLIEIARSKAGGTARRWGATEAPLLVSGTADRLLLATGSGAHIATTALASELGDTVVPRSLILSFCRAAEVPERNRNGSLLVAAAAADPRYAEMPGENPAIARRIAASG